MFGDCALGGCGRSVTVMEVICPSNPHREARSTRQTPRAAYAPQAGIVQRLGEMPDRVSEKTRRRNAGERSRGQRVTAAWRRTTLEVGAGTAPEGVYDTIVSLSQAM